MVSDMATSFFQSLVEPVFQITTLVCQVEGDRLHDFAETDEHRWVAKGDRLMAHGGVDGKFDITLKRDWKSMDEVDRLTWPIRYGIPDVYVLLMVGQLTHEAEKDLVPKRIVGKKSAEPLRPAITPKARGQNECASRTGHRT